MGIAVRVVGFIVSLLAGLGAGALVDKVAPDANLNVSREIVQSVSGNGGIDYTKIAKYIAITVLGAIIASKVLSLIGLRKYKLF